MAASAAPSTPAVSSVIAPAKTVVKTYKNCTALHKAYPGGVAKAGVTHNKVSGKKRAFTVKPKTSTALYKANKKLDRDKDGVACEK
ncbi:MAG: excalibur calcium-binding domain-containing protein [Microbacterium sp.]